MIAQRSAAILVFVCLYASVFAQVSVPDTARIPTPKPAASHSASKWYDKISLRGYSQFRYNRLLETNPDLKCEQCDKSIGKGQTFYFRRARLVFSGDIHPRVFLYIQFDYSADASSTNKHFLQVRDAYVDYAFDPKKSLRVRVGQSKVPYGFENMQSSSMRLPFDRADALNSAVPNEREMGVFFYYAPAEKRALFKMLTEEGLKGSGDYGVAALGVYSGQSANKPELNDYLHKVARFSWPFQAGNQIIEPGIQAYSGKFTLSSDLVTANIKKNKDLTYTEQRVAGSFILYPKPLGIALEYNVGEGPGFDPEIDSIRVRTLKGGYAMLSCKTHWKKSSIIPYIRYQQFDGGKKHELDARYYEVKETEIGVEWQPFRNLELTAAYMISKRKYWDGKIDADERGNLLRLQLQVNY